MEDTRPAKLNKTGLRLSGGNAGEQLPMGNAAPGVVPLMERRKFTPPLSGPGYGRRLLDDEHHQRP